MIAYKKSVGFLKKEANYKADEEKLSSLIKSYVQNVRKLFRISNTSFYYPWKCLKVLLLIKITLFHNLTDVECSRLEFDIMFLSEIRQLLCSSNTHIWSRSVNDKIVDFKIFLRKYLNFAFPYRKWKEK